MSSFRDEFFISIQNLAEFARVTSEKYESYPPVEKIEESIERFTAAFDVLKYDSSTVKHALRLKAKSGTHFFDALLAATMLENGIDTIYTENTEDFQNIPGIKAVNPLG